MGLPIGANFFNKKNGNDAAESESQQPVKSRDERLNTVLDVTTEESVIDICEENKKWITRNADGEKVYALLAVFTDKIGGLSKKQAKDAAKGSFLSQLKGHEMDYYASEATIEDECFFLVPNEHTVERAMEYGFMRNAMLYIAFLDEGGDVSILEATGVTLEQVSKAIEKGLTVDKFMETVGVDINEEEDSEDEEEKVEETTESEKDVGLSYNDDDEDEDAPDGSYEEDTENYHDDYEEDVPPEGYIDNGESEFFSENVESDDSYPTDNSTGYDEQESYDDDAEEDDVDDYEDEEVDESEEDEEYESTVKQYSDISEADAKKTLVRRFYTDDLDLHISTGPFDKQFMRNNVVPQFDEQRDVNGETGWLATYLNELAKSANSDLRRIHNDNLFLMREKYIRLLSEYCESLQRDLDTKNPSEDTKYNFAAKYEALRKGRKKELDNLDSVVTAKKAQIMKEWEDQLARVGNDASMNAQRQYRERYGRAHNDELESVEANEQKKIEDEFQDALRLLNISRRETAHASLEAATTSIISKISSEYTDCLASEKRAYNKYKKTIANFVEENRKNDIAIAESKSSEVVHKAQMDELVGQHKLEISRITADCDAKCASIRQDAENIKAVLHGEMDRVTRDCEYRLQQADEQTEKLRDELNRSYENYTTVEQRTKHEYESLINEMKNEKQAWVEKCDHIVQMNKRSNTISIVIFVVAIVAALVAGLVIGAAIFGGSKSDNNTSDTSVVSQVESSAETSGDTSETVSETTESSAESKEESSKKESSKEESSKKESSNAFGNVSISTN